MNDKQAKYFVTSRVLDICAVVVIILSFLCSMIPMALYFVEKITLKSAVVYAVASVLIGLILMFDFKFFSRYTFNFSQEDAYSLQLLKKNKNESQEILNEVSLRNCELLCENYEFKKEFYNSIFEKEFSFEQLLDRSKKQGIISFNIKNDVLKLDNDRQDAIYEILDKIASIQLGNNARFENIYNEIKQTDYLYFNNLVRFSFLNRFIENAINTNSWTIGENGEKINPFNIDAKQIASQKIAFVDEVENKVLRTDLDLFFETKYFKSLKNLQIKNIRDSQSLKLIKMEYINHFLDSDLEDDEIINCNKIPDLIDIKLRILKNRIVCNTLGEVVFEKLKNVVVNYENNTTIENANIKNFLSERNEHNINIIKIINECSDVQYLDNDEVICTVGDQQFRGFRFSNI